MANGGLAERAQTRPGGGSNRCQGAASFSGYRYATRVEEQERAPQADINPLCELDARCAYKRDPTE